MILTFGNSNRSSSFWANESAYRGTSDGGCGIGVLCKQAASLWLQGGQGAAAPPIPDLDAVDIGAAMTGPGDGRIIEHKRDDSHRYHSHHHQCRAVPQEPLEANPAPLGFCILQE